MKIVSWNVNGLRAVHRKNMWRPFLDAVSADIICLQEIKMEKDQMKDTDREIPGYTSFWNSSKERKGYAGTALYIKNELAKRLVKVHYDLPVAEFNKHGRLITLEFDTFIISNGYFPNGGRGPEIVRYKLRYYDTFLSFIESFRKNKKSIIWMGDVNTAHCPIDLARPKENETKTGFLPEERAWIDEVVAHGYIDTFRALNPDKIAYSWWDMKTRARERNVGWRIDYVFVNEELLPKVTHATIHSSIYGSDHCPVSIEVTL